MAVAMGTGKRDAFKRRLGRESLPLHTHWTIVAVTSILQAIIVGAEAMGGMKHRKMLVL